MTTQENINAALAVAVHAIPKVIDPSVRDLEEYRVRISADVTAHCRREGLLSATEFICYGAWYSSDFSKLIPAAFDDDGRKHLAGDPGVGPEREYKPVEECEELRREFLAPKAPHHPLHQKQPPR
jgi:hypothetical protein